MINSLPKTVVYGGRLKDRAALKASSSGGAFTAISDVFLNRHDAVVCSTYNYNTNQQEFVLIESIEDRNKARGSKYVQSIPGDIFMKAETWLKDHPQNNLLFVGMGCQAAGFLKYTEVKGLRDRVIVVDIICHGSPSPKIWREYAENIEKKAGSITSLTFKDKRNGWNSPTAVAIVGGREVSLRQYVKLFYRHSVLRPSCYKCPYATTERKTDITIGDFWHIEDKIPTFYEKLGTSLFIIHTERGAKIFDAIKRSIDWVESNTQDCWQKNLEHPTEYPAGREEFWRDYKISGIEYVIDKYGNVSKMVQMKQKVKKTLKKLRGY